jgi:hypothetical protein
VEGGKLISLVISAGRFTHASEMGRWASVNRTRIRMCGSRA